MSHLLAFDLDVVTENEIIEEEPWYPKLRANNQTSIKQFLAHCVGSVHTIASMLHEAKDRGRLQIYFGRSSLAPKRLINRWRDAEKNRGHEFGVILCTLPTKESMIAERAAIRVFKKLEENDKICIGELANKHSGSAGPIPDNEESLIYATWTIMGKDQDYIIKKPTDSDIEDFAEEINIEELGEKSIKEIFELTRLYTFRYPIKWLYMD